MAFKEKFKKFQSLQVNDEYLLRQVNPEKDLKAYHEIYCDIDAFCFYVGALKETPEISRTMKILENQIKEFQKAKVYSWTIAEMKSGKALGRILLSNFESNNKIANIGYWIGRDSWGKGIISNCIKPVVEFGFSYLELERIYTTIHSDNIASWKALEKNGFIREGLLRHCFELHSGLCDCYMYSKLSTDK
jgi:RimJ/RimL family protein N-acetyltransferase